MKLLPLITLLGVSLANAGAVCYTEYGGPPQLEHRATHTLIEVVYMDGPVGMETEASWAYDDETGISICKIWIRIPDKILGSADMDGMGHELLHCLTGDYHPDYK